MESRDTCVFLAKLAEQAERYDEMVRCKPCSPQSRAQGRGSCPGDHRSLLQRPQAARQRVGSC